MAEPLIDAGARRRIREDFDTTLVVEAAAGTGKTTELVGRIAAILSAGRTTLDRIVAVTFTDRAAGELKLRLRTQLEELRLAADTGEAERARLDAALAALETAHIGTIHAFCLDLLRERPVQAGVDPAFEVVADSDALVERAFDGWYQPVLDAPPEGVRRILRRRGWGSGPRDVLLGAVRMLIDRRDFAAPWRRDPFDRDGRIDSLLEKLDALAQLATRATPDDYLAKNLAELAAFVDGIRARERTSPRDYDRLEHELASLERAKWHYKGRGEWYAKELRREDVLRQRDALKSELDRFCADAEADLAACLERELREVVDRYQELKRRAGSLDYMDMLICARDMLKSDAAVRAALQQRFTHLFVDEFQDTDPLQAEILLLLAADDPGVTDMEAVRPVAGKLFVVGDPKQAIYRFRRADVLLYQRVKQQLCRHGGEVLSLTTSFRSLPAIQAAVNASFEPLMKQAPPRAGQAEYVPLSPYRSAAGDQPALVALPVPDPYSEHGYFHRGIISASTCDAVAAWVHWLVTESGWTVSERCDGREIQVPVETRHVCLLFRRFRSLWEGDVTRQYVRALEARRVAHVLVGGTAFHTREEVMALVAALNAIEWPDDELSVYATLRGPLMSLTDEQLLDYKRAHKRLQPLRPISDDELATMSESEREVARALALLAELYRGRNHRPIATTIGRLLEATRAHASFAIWPSGEQALANVLRLLDEARRFEHGGATSFRAFVEHLEQQAQRGQGSEAAVVEEGTEGVRIMTVHTAKGLEFPVVVLCDPMNSGKATRPSRYLDPARGLWAFDLAGCTPADLRDREEEVLEQDNAESVRISYVAATRARDVLVVPVVGDERREGWVDVLHPAFYPAHAQRRDARPAPRCPSFGSDSVRTRPARTQAMPDDCVKPGLHERCAGEHPVVWWDPNVLALDVTPAGGLRQMELLERAGDSSHSEVVADRYRSWRQKRDLVLARAAEPGVVAQPVTALAARPDAPLGAPVADHVAQPDRTSRPHGSRFGTLVHTVLAAVPLDSDRATIAQLAAAMRRLLAASEDEERAAVSVVEMALAHPLLARARSADDCRREVPVILRLDDGTLAEGIVDLAFCEQGRWTVVDFKTDAAGPSSEARDAYANQVRLYQRAIEAATGQPSEGALLWL